MDLIYENATILFIVFPNNSGNFSFVILFREFSLFSQQQQQQQTQEANLLNSIDIQNVNITLGTPIYTERFEVPRSQGINNNDNAAIDSSIYSFAGNGTLNDIEISATGSGNITSR